jgi:MraZ protein
VERSGPYWVKLDNYPMPIKLPFLSYYPGIVDDKGRLSIPADYRHALAPECENYLVFDLGSLESGKFKFINAFPLDFYNTSWQKAQPDSVDYASKENTDLDLTLLPDAVWRQLDAQGRVTIPKPILEKAGMSRDIVYVGRRTHFTVWDSKTYEQYQNLKSLTVEQARAILIEQSHKNSGK